MKNFFVILYLMLLFSACTKDSEKSSQQPISVDTYWDGALQFITYYEYDNMQRIKKITQTPADNSGQDYLYTYEYYSDSVVVNELNTRTTYFLNNAGLATSAVTNYIENPHGLGFDYTFTYDPNGYLIQKREIFSQVAGGNLLRDTGFISYTITNGNITKASGTLHADINFEYSKIPYRENINVSTLRYGSFLGKPPVNLVSITKDNTGQITTTYDYEVGFSGRIISQTVRQTAPGSKPAKYVYHYAN